MKKEELLLYRKEVANKIANAATDIPGQRAAYKEGYSFSKLPFGEQAEIWDDVWKHSGNYRAQLQAFFFIEKHLTKKDLLRKIWAITESWQEDVNDWSLCDALAKIYTKVLELEPEKVYKRLKQWNRDENLWKRRQSVVSLLYFSRTKKIYLPYKQICALVKPLLKDKEYYVQKGVGWCMREIHTVYPEQGFEFIKENIKDISSIAFTISIEKMSTEQKEGLKKMRKD